jgi:ParB/RepB/Spo0J family partition protein
MSMKFGKASNRRLALAAVPRESSAADRLLDNSRQMVPLALIDDNPRNPRTRIDQESVDELAASIAEHGLLQAPVVRRHPDDPARYMVVLGSRRIAAHRLLGRDEIEVIVRRLDDQQAFLASCVENVQRVELSPREEMDMIGVLVDELGSQEAAARALGKSPTWLSKRKRVLAVPAMAAAVERGEISLDHAYDLIARSPDEAVALAHLERVRAGRQNQGATRDALAPRQRPAPTTATNSAPPSHSAPALSRRVPTMDPVSVRNPDDRHAGTPEQTAPSRAAASRRSVASVAPREVPISDRNRAVEQPTPEGDAGDDLVELEALRIVRLARAEAGRAARRAVLSALRADLASLEGD